MAQVVTCNIPLASDQSSVVITFYADLGNQGLKNYTGNVHAHTGVITNLSADDTKWRYVKTDWEVNTSETRLTRVSANQYTLTISPSIRAFYGVPSNEIIKKLCFVFRSEVKVDGKYKEGKGDGNSDILLTIFVDDLSVLVYKPLRTNPLIDLNAELDVEIYSLKSTSLELYHDDVLINSTNNKSIITKITASSYGKHTIKAKATDGTKTVEDITYYYVRPAVNVAELPANVLPGINYINDNSATLVLHDPAGLKQFAFVIGDFTNWELDSKGYMNKTPDNKYYWITINNLTAGQEYAFQYLIDGNLKLADPYCEKILDPWNDKYINEKSVIYPNLKSYPEGKTTGVVSILQTAQTSFTWTTANFQPPAVNNLVVYELLVRDFVESRDIKTISYKDTINYLKRLGINAIEIMPICEFDGNNSWGYNPNFYFATDKAYGTKNDYKAFIDECHKNGIAVIVDMVLNHSYGLSPMVQMYYNFTNYKVTSDNPWYNVDATHDFNVGYDFNHESQYTREFCKRVMKFWLTEYKVDGFRFDLSKGFTQVNSVGNVSKWGQKDDSRIAIWNDYYSFIKSVNDKAYVILEHFADNSEETILANNGMLFWGNLNNAYCQSSMGFSTENDFSWISYKNRGWTNPNVLGYMESHDEERLMYKNKTWGNISGTYNIKDFKTGLKRAELSAAMFFTIPGPKMIWQFGELGYDISINYPGRTDPKPVLWNYRTDANRNYLYHVYAKLIDFKKQYLNEAPTDFTVSGSGLFKQIKIEYPDKKFVILGNFETQSGNYSVNFPQTGIWYDYYTSDEINVTSNPFTIQLQPGEYHIYSNVKLSVKPILTVSTNTLNVEAASMSNNSFNITSNTNWVVGSSETWITTTTGYGNGNAKVYLVAEKNNTQSSRQSTVTVAAIGVSPQTITVTQAAGATGITEINLVDDLIYPNPVKNSIKFRQFYDNCDVAVFDMSGKLIYMNKIKNQSFNINHLKTGSYILKIQTKNKIISQKIIKE